MNEGRGDSGDARVVLGVDPGTGRMGWGVIEKKRGSGVVNQEVLSLVECGLIETGAHTPLPDRLELIFHELTRVIEKHRPAELAIEQLFFVKNVTTGMSVAHARGVAILAAQLAKMSVFEYSPNEIKLAITGYGRADKSQIVKMLKLHLKGCSIKQDDTADAVAVALTHLQMKKKYH